MNLLQKRRQKRPTKIGTRLLGSEMLVPISRSRDPGQGGHVRAWCSRSHVHWDSSLEPSAEDVKKAQDEADKKNKAP